MKTHTYDEYEKTISRPYFCTRCAWSGSLRLIATPFILGGYRVKTVPACPKCLAKKLVPDNANY